MGTRGGDRPPLVELGPVPEFWIDGAEAEQVAERVWRLRLWKTHRPPGEDQQERIIQVDLLTDLAHIRSVMVLLHSVAAGVLDVLKMTQQ